MTTGHILSLILENVCHLNTFKDTPNSYTIIITTAYINFVYKCVHVLKKYLHSC